MAVLFEKEPCEHETACDLYGGLTNLAWVIQGDQALALYDRLQRTMYSDAVYQASKDWLEEFESSEPAIDEPSPDWAYHYFVASWMGRNGVTGTERVNYQIATRWTKGGGSGPLRFRNAADSIPAWCDRLRNVQVLRRSLFDMLPKLEDDAGVAVYVDPPYLHGTVARNSRYLHDFGPAEHKRLATELKRFRRARVVVSYYADRQLEALYPRWTFLDCSRHKHLHCQNRRGSTRTEAPEVSLVNGPAIEGEERKGLFE